ncbi:MAG: RDD family protein [Mycobacterium sp.]
MASMPPTVVTGDAVVLDVAVAQLPVRALGALIDLIVVGTGYVVALVLSAAALPHFDDAFAAALVVIFTVAVLVGYPVAMETATRGRSLGKMVMGLRVVSDDGGPERFRQALFRALAGVVEIWMLLGTPAVIASLLSARGKRIGDMFAGTVVISERGPKSVAPPAMPPALAWWAGSLELSGLGPQQAEMARQFLARAPELSPAVREQMGYQVMTEVVSRISPPPPPGAPPQQVLAAVLAERHRRALARMTPTSPPPPPYPATHPPAAPPAPARPNDGGFVPPG